jgi:hypothetical protein
MGKKNEKEKPFEIRWKTDLPYKYAIGKLSVKFFDTLKKERKLLGSKCPKCGKMHFPPRGVYAECVVRMTVDDMVEVPPTGTLVGFTVVNYPFVDPQTGGMRPFPYGYGLFQLDGADTYTMHFINEKNHNKMKIGQRVKAVFKDEMEGTLGDIPYFEIIREE